MLSALVSTVALVGAPDGSADRFTLRGKVVRVVHGDTVDVRLLNGRTTRVRVVGIDAPAPGECFYRQANARARELAAGRSLTLVGEGTRAMRARDERIVGSIAIRGHQDLGQAMLETGHARVHVLRRSFSRTARYRVIETRARKGRRGLWGACGAPPPPAPVGATFHCMWGQYYDDAQRALMVDKLKAAGMAWVRIDFGWPWAEPSKGVRSASYVESFARCVNFARARGLSVVALVLGTPGWANGNAGQSVPPTNPDDYRDFLNWATLAFPGVAAWQLWNEPNSPEFWKGTNAQYVSLLKAGYEGVKSASPRDLVVTGGTTFYQGPEWVEAMYANGAKGYFDVIATHPYHAKGDEAPEYAPDASSWWFANNPPAIRDVMLANGDFAKEIWITEFGYSAHANEAIPPGSDYAWALGVSEAQQADYAVRAIKYARVTWPYVTALFWYKERSYPYGTYSPEWFDLHVQHYGLLRSDWSERPVFGALRRYLSSRTGTASTPRSTVSGPRDGGCVPFE